MRLRERIRQVFHRFERALTRVEDQGVRIEQGVDNIIDLVQSLSEAVADLKTDVIQRDARRGEEIRWVKEDLSKLQKKLDNTLQ